MTTIEKKHCLPCEGSAAALNNTKIQELHSQLLAGWTVKDNKEISKDFSFKNFYQTMAFVNAIAWIANQENHHPDLEIGFNHCLVRYTTHALKGLSENDFICAAKVDLLLSKE